MDGIAKATRQSFRMHGRSYVAFIPCPIVPIAAWLEEIDVALVLGSVATGADIVVRRVYSRSASRPCDGGFQRQRHSTDLPSKDSSRVVGHQPLLPGCGQTSPCAIVQHRRVWKTLA